MAILCLVAQTHAAVRARATPPPQFAWWEKVRSSPCAPPKAGKRPILALYFAAKTSLRKFFTSSCDFLAASSWYATVVPFFTHASLNANG